MVKIKKCKSVSFYTGKNWIFRQKFPEDATFNEYNIIIPISKCKDSFSPFSGEIRPFSGSKPILYRVNKESGRINRYMHCFAALRRGPRQLRRKGGGMVFWGSHYNVCIIDGQSLQVAKKISNICVNFQHNIVLIFQ